MKTIESFSPLFELEEPTEFSKIGNNHAIYLPKEIASAFFYKQEKLYPLLVDIKLRDKEQLCLGMYFSEPEDYDGSGYTIYRLLRGTHTCTYLPFPKKLWLGLFGSSRKKPRVKYRIGKDENDLLLIVFEKTK
jgi:hypothetical protein